MHWRPFIQDIESNRIRASRQLAQLCRKTRMTSTPASTPPSTPSPRHKTLPAQPIKLYRSVISGHSHRVELFLSLLGLPFECVDVDLVAKGHKTPAFLAMNAFGQVPVIDDGGTIISDSNAILVYLAKKYGNGRWLPADPLGEARVQRWLSVAAGQVAFGAGRSEQTIGFTRRYCGGLWAA